MNRPAEHKSSLPGASELGEGNKVRWEYMLPDELDAALAQCPLAYLTYGLCEPHGLHSAVGLDGIKAHGVACRAARAHGGIVAPPFLWHIHEIGYEAAWAERVGPMLRFLFSAR